jgi:protein-tyrosine-phosphatase
MPGTRTVVFVCQHGAAKSVIAAARLEQLAQEAGVPVHALARGTEPDPEVYASTVEGLLAEGVDVRAWRPQPTQPEEFATAWRVVSLGPELAELGLAAEQGEQGEHWSVPAVSDGFAPADAAITSRVATLLDALRSDEA